MPRARSAALAIIRCATLCVALGALFLVGGGALRGVHSDMARAIVVLLVAGGALLALGGDSLLPRSWRGRPVVPLALLALDLVVIGAVGTYLRLPDSLTIMPAPSVPFLVGYLVAVLVAVTGRKPAAAALGVLAGAMLLLLAESRLMRTEVPPASPAGRSTAHALRPAAAGHPAAAPGTVPNDPVDVDPSGPEDSREIYLWLRIFLVGAAALETALVSGWIDSEVGRRRTAATVERELRAREMVATELSVFSGESKTVGSLTELCESLLLHLRMHFPTAARAVFVEDGGERVGVWEEAGAVDDRLAEERRRRLQDALREAGSAAVLSRLEVRQHAGSSKGRGAALRTGVGVPVHAAGHVGGVIFVGDSRRDAIPADRLGALAEVGRLAGDALRRIERTREEQTRRMALLIAQMREGVLLLGPDGRAILVNSAGRKMLEALGQDVSGPIVLGDASAASLAAIPTGTVRRYTLTADDGGGKGLRLSVVAVGVADNGTRLGTLVTLADVTEEEQARRRLMQAEKMSVVGQTLASVAHELNNPLSAIVGYADLLVESSVPPDVEKLLARIREQATRTSRIVKNLLNVARRRGPERTRTSMNDVATSVVDLFVYDARLHNIAVTTELDPSMPPVLADRHALQQVLVNLCQNAIHALRGAGRPGQVEIRTRADRLNAYLSVRDDGPGIPHGLRTRVFEAFFTTKGADEGTGLGLAISRGIAREHGGDLVLEDRGDGQPGAQFTVRIPLEAKVSPVRPAPETVVPDGVPARVLVVDDEAPVRDSLIATLARLGAHADGLGSADEAERQLARGVPYDAVLLDVRLPGRSGLELHRDLAARNPMLARKIVFMTGDLMNEDVTNAIKATGNALLEKPFTAEELRVVLARSAAKQKT